MTVTETKKKESFWGKGIFIFYGAFVVVVLGTVLFASMQRFDLVENNYYEKELKYQQQIDRMNRVEAMVEKPSWRYDRSEHALFVQFPKNHREELQGTILVFRPSNASYDISSELMLDKNGEQRISLEKKPKGLWRIKISWRYDNQEYYIEDLLVVE